MGRLWCQREVLRTSPCHGRVILYAVFAMQRSLSHMCTITLLHHKWVLSFWLFRHPNIKVYRHSYIQDRAVHFVMAGPPRPPSNVQTYEYLDSPFISWTDGGCDCVAHLESWHYNLDISHTGYKLNLNTTYSYHNLTVSFARDKVEQFIEY